VNSPTFPWLRASFLPMLVNTATHYSKPDQDHVTQAALLVAKKVIKNAFPTMPPQQQAVVCSAHSIKVHLLKLWWTKYFVDHVDWFFIYAEMGKTNWTEMHPKFEESLIPSIFITTCTVDRTDKDLSPACHDVITTLRWVLNKQLQGICTSCPAWPKQCS